ncbi:MAG: hypothetical protein IJ651_01585 [Bacteroidales bacterium]|nr:hypothetical protein [Bacteroidales bacterium]
MKKHLLLLDLAALLAACSAPRPAMQRPLAMSQAKVRCKAVFHGNMARKTTPAAKTVAMLQARMRCEAEFSCNTAS